MDEDELKEVVEQRIHKGKAEPGRWHWTEVMRGKGGIVDYGDLDLRWAF